MHASCWHELDDLELRRERWRQREELAAGAAEDLRRQRVEALNATRFEHPHAAREAVRVAKALGVHELGGEDRFEFAEPHHPRPRGGGRQLPPQRPSLRARLGGRRVGVPCNPRPIDRTDLRLDHLVVGNLGNGRASSRSAC